MKKKSAKYQHRMEQRRLKNGTDTPIPTPPPKTIFARCFERREMLLQNGVSPQLIYSATDVGRTMRRSQFCALIEACDSYLAHVKKANSLEAIPYRDAVADLCEEIFTGQDMAGFLVEDRTLMNEWNENSEYKVFQAAWARLAYIGIGKNTVAFMKTDINHPEGWRYGWPWESTDYTQ